jgi:SAM-dependent methyltransferase
MCYMREISLQVLYATFVPGQRVLEIGCGTGEEAIQLARRGVRVLATDPSPRMLELTAHKVARSGLHDLVQTRLMSAGEVSTLTGEYGEAAFDGAYSSFGPLNGEPDLKPVSDALAVLVRRGGALVVSVMNRFYPVETVWYLAHGQPRQATRRWSGQAMASVSPALSVNVPTWYYTPSAFQRAFAHAFRRVHCAALPLLLPPPLLSHLWIRFPSLVHRLVPLERKAAAFWPLNALGDHFLMVLRRVG